MVPLPMMRGNGPFLCEPKECWGFQRCPECCLGDTVEGYLSNKQPCRSEPCLASCVAGNGPYLPDAAIGDARGRSNPQECWGKMGTFGNPRSPFQDRNIRLSLCKKSVIKLESYLGSRIF